MRVEDPYSGVMREGDSPCEWGRAATTPARKTSNATLFMLDSDEGKSSLSNEYFGHTHTDAHVMTPMLCIYACVCVSTF